MKKFLSKYWLWALTFLGVAVWLFWGVGYPHALAYHEQFQLFLFDGDYFAERVAVPGGLARWVAELLVQFYNNAFLGATVLALLFMLIYMLSIRITGFKMLGLVPVFLLWFVMGDENVMLTYAVALLMALAVCWGVRSLLSHRWALLGVAVLGMPLLYWLIGPMALLVALYVTLVLSLKAPYRLFTVGVGLLALLLVTGSAAVSSHLVPYPQDRLFIGLDYYRVPQVLPAMFVVIPVAVVLLAIVSAVWKTKIPTIVQAVSLAVVLALGVWLVPRGFDAKKYELIAYDYLVRTGQWQAVINKAEQQQPDLPMSVSATNLALAMENQLGERAFHFYQRGTQGLVPLFERNFSTTMLTGEIYFRLGMVNTAQRFAFEAMEALPNYNKSVRAVKRLAETNLINGQYEVAQKYLQLLEKTFFYRKWARQVMTLLDDESKIDAHPLYGDLRRKRLVEDFLFSDRETDRMCGQLFLHNPQNKVAMQYLLMWPLLNRDIPTFMSYVQVVQQRVQYYPRHIQEAICYAFAQQQQKPPQQLVNEIISQQFLQFANAFNHGGRQNPSQIQPFKNTVWYYLVAPGLNDNENKNEQAK